jgi:hypothetical protein
MTFPFAMPDWVPWWVPLVLIVPAALYALALLFMPFAVMGVKSRLEAIDLRLDEIQGEIRSLVLRLPEPMRGTADFDDSYISPPPAPPQRAQRAETIGLRPPIPPAAHPPIEKLAAVDRRLASVRRPEDRRPEDRRPEDRRPEDRRPEDRSTEERRGMAPRDHDDDTGRAEPRLNWPR